MSRLLKFLLFFGCLTFFLYRMSLFELLYIRNTNPTCAEKTLPSPAIQSFLAKPLSFLGIGSQCIAFTTKDSPFVCKICKANRYQAPFILEAILPSFAYRKNEKKQEKKKRDFLSYQAAYEHLQEQTGVVFLHLEQTTHLKTNICLLDPLHLPHTVSCDALTFYIQKKASPLAAYLETSDIATLRSFFKQLFIFAQQSCKKGFWIKDICLKNIGVYEGKPLWIDPGRVIFDQTLKETLITQNHLRTLANELQDALAEKHPNLVSLVEESLYPAFEQNQ